MKKLCMTFALLVLSACGDDADENPEIDSTEQASQTWPAPYKIMMFPEDQGSWLGNSAGQIAYAPFSRYGSECAYGFDDGAININQNTNWPYSTCAKTASNTVVCSGHSFVCPVQSCVGTPSLWATEPGDPDHWGWTNGVNAPGNHGWYPGTVALGSVPRQCNNGAPTISFNPNGTGGALLSCSYPMPTYWLRQY